MKYIWLLCTICVLSACDLKDQEYRSWEVYKGGPEANNYSALDQINSSNVQKLEVAWTFYPNDAPEGFSIWKYECNPIVVDQVMYIVSAWRWLYALNAVTGDILWSFDPLDGERGGGVSRGVTYWKDPQTGEARIFFSARNQLFSIDASTGLPDRDFGENGSISLGIRRENQEIQEQVRLSTPGIIYENLIIVGATVSESSGAAPGDVRAFNTKTGALEWTFHTIPLPGEYGHDTWPEEAYQYAGAANNWAGMSLDEERGLVYVPTGSPTYDYYGGDRIGANLFGNTLIALDAATGKRVWHFQTVHHDIWDYDLPTAPNLVTLERDGQKIDAVAQPSKMGFIYVLDRETGEPLFPIEEREVPPSRITGEQAWPTQPFPLKPEPFIRQAIKAEDIYKPSEESYLSNQHTVNELWFKGLYTPLDGETTLMLPGSRGGAEWGGAAYDPVTGVLYINSNELAELGRVEQVQQVNFEGKSLFEAGQELYQRHCASCHGMNKEGMESMPSLINIEERLSREDMLNIIGNGSAIMPAFRPILENAEEELVAFLTERGKETPADASQSRDTTFNYLNVANKQILLDSLERPILSPPWATLSAIDLNTGEYRWQVPLGSDTRYQKAGEPPTGIENYGGPVVTSGGLVFVAATMDSRFRAFDKNTGELLWEYELPGNGLANPAVYEVAGKQYIAIAVSIGENLQHHNSAVVVFALPE